jgi:hypothetical protein
MNRRSILGYAATAAVGMGVVLGGVTAATPAHAQYAYACAPGYYFAPGYGCVPGGYVYGPPYYPYPDYGLGFFYGSGWGGGWHGGWRGGGGFHGGGFHGGGHGR